MQRLIILSTLFCMLSMHAFTQCENGQLTAEVIGEISNDHRHNNVFTYGMVSYQSHEDNFYYESSEDPSFYLGYGKSLWVASNDQDGNLRMSANTYPTLSKHDYIPGPLDRSTGMPIDAECDVYNRVWIIKGLDLFLMQTQFQAGTLTEENIPKDILEWPAKGNPYLGDNAPDFDLAPFLDFAEDGIYDPLSGDYPIALDESPDFLPHEFSYIVYNDLGTHTQSGGEGTGVEVQQINYVVNCSQAAQAEQAVFTRLKYGYYGQETLADLKIALFEDNDLACNENDYTGCDLELNCSYFYNRGGETWLEECHDPDVPDNNGAVRTTVFFTQTMKSFKHWYLLGVGDTLIPGIDPTGAQEFYNYMNGQWRDGTAMSTSENGYDADATETTLFAFPDRPNDSFGWSMQTAGISVPSDVRGLTTLIDEQNVEPGHSGIIDFADHFLYDKERKRLEVFDVWPSAIEDLKSEYSMILDGSFSCGSGLEICTDDCVWPGDADRDLTVDGKDIVVTGLFAGMNISDGTARGIISTEWYGFNSDDWSSSYNGINAKNADINGNGIINENDLESLTTNYGRTRGGHVSARILEDKVDQQGLRVEFEEELVDLETAVLFDRIIETEISLGLINQIEEPIYGLSFDIQFDTNLVRPFVKIDGIFSEVFQFGHGGMSNAVRDGNELKGDDNIKYGFTNLDGANTEIGGSIVKQNFFIKDGAATNNPDGRDTLVVQFYNVCAINALGEPLDIGVLVDSLFITGLVYDPNIISDVKDIEASDSRLHVYPNPARDLVYVDIEAGNDGTLTIMDLQGRALQQSRVRGGARAGLSLSGIENGLYLIQLRKENGELLVKQFVKHD